MNHYQKNKNRLEKLRSSFFLMGLIMACGFTFLAFEWTTITSIPEPPTGIIIDPFDEDDPPITRQDPTKPPPVKSDPPPQLNPNQIDIIDDTEGNPDDNSDPNPDPDLNFNPDDWKPVNNNPPPPKPPTIVGWASKMPHYKDCANLNEEERKNCTRQIMYDHFNENAHVPATVKIRGAAEYTAFVYFEINTKGEIDNVKILNNKKHKIPRELEREAFNAVKTLPHLIPGKNHGKPVIVRYKIPIKFTVR